MWHTRYNFAESSFESESKDNQQRSSFTLNPPTFTSSRIAAFSCSCRSISMRHVSVRCSGVAGAGSMNATSISKCFRRHSLILFAIAEKALRYATMHARYANRYQEANDEHRATQQSRCPSREPPLRRQATRAPQPPNPISYFPFTIHPPLPAYTLINEATNCCHHGYRADHSMWHGDRTALGRHVRGQVDARTDHSV